jgi:molybdopterin-binding protein
LKKLSARNQLQGKVVEVRKGQTTAHVRIDIGNGVVITSSITNEAVDDLGLAMGDDVVAVIKASDVMVGKRTELCPDRRLLGGHGPQPYLERVTSASRAPGAPSNSGSFSTTLFCNRSPQSLSM